MAYRNDVEALAARLKDLESEVGDRTRERDEVAQLLAEARARESAERYIAETPRRQRKQRIIVVAVLASLVVIGAGFAMFRTTCRGDRPDYIAEATAKLQEFTNQMCQCHDATCAQKVSDELTKWAQDMAKRHPSPPPGTPTEQQQKDITAIAEKLGNCMQKAMTASAPNPNAPSELR